jgi:putative SOS response-associated peptidase YedK
MVALLDSRIPFAREASVINQHSLPTRMCGRFWLLADWLAIEKEFGISEHESLRASFNIAPTQIAAVILDENPSIVVGLQWGLIPSWSKEPKMQYSTINAKAETLQEKPSYRTLVQRRRCVIIADGFYEWKTNGKTKQPYAITYKKGLFAMAGLWDEWHGNDKTLRTFTIITTSANKLMQPIHERMPVMLTPDQVPDWLAEGNTELLKPFPAEQMSATPISTLVNSPRNNTPDVLKPITTL